MSIRTRFEKILNSGNNLITLHKECKNGLPNKSEEKQTNWVKDALEFADKSNMPQLSTRIKELNNEFRGLKNEKTEAVSAMETKNNKMDHLSQEYFDENIHAHEMSDNYDKLIKEKFIGIVSEVNDCKIYDWIKEHPKLTAIYGFMIAIIIHIVGSIIFYLLFGRLIY